MLPGDWLDDVAVDGAADDWSEVRVHVDAGFLTLDWTTSGLEDEELEAAAGVWSSFRDRNSDQSSPPDPT